MSRTLALPLALIAALAFTGTASAKDSAVGGSNNTEGFFQIGLAAHSDAFGQDPRGHVSARSRPQGGFPVPFRFSGEVTCLRVDGNRAAIKYRFDQADNPALVGGGIEIFLEDNGPASPAGAPDAAAFGPPMPPLLFELAGPATCDDPNLAPYQPIQRGNFTVTDDLG